MNFRNFRRDAVLVIQSLAIGVFFTVTMLTFVIQFS